METPKPKALASIVELDPSGTKDELKVAVKPHDRKKSTPVRNPAFREHEGLKALQRELNTRKK